MNSSFSDVRFDLKNPTSSPRWLEIMTAVWLSFLLVFGTVVNGVALVIFIRSRLVSGSNNVLIASLLVNNIGIALFGFPLAIVAEISSGWMVNLNMAACIYNAFVVYLLGLSSMYLLASISVTRYFVITHATTVGKKITVKVTVCIVILCYLAALLLALAPLFGLGSFGLEEHGTSCGLAWNDRSLTNRIYLLLILFSNLGIPVLIMMFCYGSIYRTVKKAAIGTEVQTSRIFIAQRRREKHLLKMCVSMVAAFVLSWTPYALVSFYQAFGPGTSLSPVITRIPAIVAKTSVLWDPIIYALNTSSFRQHLRNLFGMRRSDSFDVDDTDPSDRNITSPNNGTPIPKPDRA